MAMKPSLFKKLKSLRNLKDSGSPGDILYTKKFRGEPIDFKINYLPGYDELYPKAEGMPNAFGYKDTWLMNPDRAYSYPLYRNHSNKTNEFIHENLSDIQDLIDYDMYRPNRADIPEKPRKPFNRFSKKNEYEMVIPEHTLPFFEYGDEGLAGLGYTDDEIAKLKAFRDKWGDTYKLAEDEPGFRTRNDVFGSIGDNTYRAYFYPPERK